MTAAINSIADAIADVRRTGYHPVITQTAKYVRVWYGGSGCELTTYIGLHKEEHGAELQELLLSGALTESGKGKTKRWLVTH